MNEIVAKAMEWARRYGTLSLPLRLLLGALVSALAGAGLGIVAEYAAYNYAYHYGFRPPLEGIPYLRVAVTAITVISLVGAAGMFALVYVIAALTLAQINNAIRRTDWSVGLVSRVIQVDVEALLAHALIDQFRAVSFRRALFLASATGGAIGAVALLVMWFRGDESWPALVLGAYAAIGILILWNRQVTVWLGLAAVVAVLIVVPLLLFNVNVYGSALRALGYGGGLSVRVVLVDESGANEEAFDAALLLRTSAAIIVFDPDKRLIREVQLSRVQYIDHEARRLAERSVRLPW